MHEKQSLDLRQKGRQKGSEIEQAKLARHMRGMT